MKPRLINSAIITTTAVSNEPTFIKRNKFSLLSVRHKSKAELDVKFDETKIVFMTTDKRHHKNNFHGNDDILTTSAI